ncbi:MAG: hypothetical protein QE271_04865 [Bacteriovoracaceae bacterium]|nr:hypothetical protein [Bacteriovoracaceae bacterium]
MKRVFLIALALVLSNIGLSKVSSKFSLLIGSASASDHSPKEGGNSGN